MVTFMREWGNLWSHHSFFLVRHSRVPFIFRKSVRQSRLLKWHAALFRIAYSLVVRLIFEQRATDNAKQLIVSFLKVILQCHDAILRSLTWYLKNLLAIIMAITVDNFVLRKRGRIYSYLEWKNWQY